MLDYSTIGSKYLEKRKNVYHEEGLLVVFFALFFKQMNSFTHLNWYFLQSFGQKSEALRHDVLRVSHSLVHVANTPAESVSSCFFLFFFFPDSVRDSRLIKTPLRSWVSLCNMSLCSGMWVQTILINNTQKTKDKADSKRRFRTVWPGIYVLISQYTHRLSVLSSVPWNTWD